MATTGKYVLTRTEVRYIIEALDAANTVQQLETGDEWPEENGQADYNSGYEDGINLAITMLKNLDKNSTGR